MATNPLTIAYGNQKRPLKLHLAEIACYILSNNQSVVSKNSIQKALGYDGKSEHWLPDLLQHIHKFYPINSLVNAVQKPFFAEIETLGVKHIVACLEFQFFIGICESLVIAKSEGYLNVNQLKYAKAAEKILEFLSDKDLGALITEITGFRYQKVQAIIAFEQFLLTQLGDDAFRWVKTIPDAYFEKIFAVYGLDWKELQQQPKNAAKTICETVFSRLSDELLDSLRNERPKRVYNRKNNLPQDNQHPQLKAYFLELFELLDTAGGNWNIFLQLLNRSHPKNPNFFIAFRQLPEKAIDIESLSAFNTLLKKMS